MKRINVLLTSFCLLTLILGSCNSAKGQVLTGTKDITIERLNTIVDKLFGGLSYNDKVYSQEFGTLLKENESAVFQGNRDNLSLPEELFFDDSIVAMGIGGEEMTPNAQRQYELVSSSEDEAVVHVTLDENFGEMGKLHDEYKLCLIKEKGIWVLDDILFVSDKEWSSKYWLKKDIIESTTLYDGHMLDEFDPRPFKMCVNFYKYPDENGVKRVRGVFKFDSTNEEDGWSFFEGTLKNGKVFIMVNEDDNGVHSFSWETSSEGMEVRGEWQAYNPDGRIAISREFVMTILK